MRIFDDEGGSHHGGVNYPLENSNHWYRIAFTYDFGSGDIKIYVDGEQVHRSR